MRYDVLLCDADNTLFDFNKAEENAFAIACETMGFSSAPELLATFRRLPISLDEAREAAAASGFIREHLPSVILAAYSKA